ncbi:hypothetical protein ACWGJ9_11915 [Curtobacterium citreum]
MPERKRASRRAARAAQRRKAENGTSLQQERLRYRKPAEPRPVRPGENALRVRLQVPPSDGWWEEELYAYFHKPLLRRVDAATDEPGKMTPSVVFIPRSDFDYGIIARQHPFFGTRYQEVGEDLADVDDDVRDVSFEFLEEHMEDITSDFAEHLLREDLRDRSYYPARRSDAVLDLSSCAQTPESFTEPLEVVIRGVERCGPDPETPASGTPSYRGVTPHRTTYMFTPEPRRTAVAATAFDDLDPDDWWRPKVWERHITFTEGTPHDVVTFLSQWDASVVIEKRLQSIAAAEYLHALTGLPPAYGERVTHSHIRRLRPGRIPKGHTNFAIDVTAPAEPTTSLTSRVRELMPNVRIDVPDEHQVALTLTKTGLAAPVTADLYREQCITGLDESNTSGWTDDDRRAVTEWLQECLKALADARADIDTRMRVVHGWYHQWPYSRTTGSDDLGAPMRVVSVEVRVPKYVRNTVGNDLEVHLEGFLTAIGNIIPADVHAESDMGSRDVYIGTFIYRSFADVINRWMHKDGVTELSQEPEIVVARAIHQGNVAAADVVLREFEAAAVSAAVGLI